MKKAYNMKCVDLGFKDINTNSRTIVAQFSSYGNVDADGDIATQGMFTKSINENFRRIKHLMNHDITEPLGVPVRIWDDADGAYIESKIGTHEDGNDFLEMATSGLISEHSFGYQVVKQESTAQGNRLLEVKLWEVSSLTAWGANPMTPLLSVVKGTLKGDVFEKVLQRQKKLEKFVKSATIKEETIELLLLEIKQLQSFYADLLKGTEPEYSTQPRSMGKEEENEPAIGDSEDDELLTAIKLLSFKF